MPSFFSRLLSKLTGRWGPKQVIRVASSTLPTEFGRFDIHVFENGGDGEEHVALICGDLDDGEDVLTRLHSSCVTGDIFHSARCDCGPQLQAAMQRVSEEGRGIILYLSQEGRGIGLANKIKAYALQDQGLDTVEANEMLGFAADGRDYGVGVQILRDLGVRSMRLLSNNPRKLAGVTGDGLIVSELLPIEMPVSDSTRRYLTTKKEKLGHQLTTV